MDTNGEAKEKRKKIKEKKQSYRKGRKDAKKDKHKSIRLRKKNYGGTGQFTKDSNILYRSELE